MKTPEFVTKHYRALLVVAVVVILYLAFTRSTTKVIGTVDASGQGMSVNGVVL
jgi:hypothetical protein